MHTYSGGTPQIYLAQYLNIIHIFLMFLLSACMKKELSKTCFFDLNVLYVINKTEEKLSN